MTVRQSIQTCYCCKSSQNQHILAENGFNLVRCIKCGTMFVCDPPSEEEITQSVESGIYEGEKTLDVNVRYNSSALAFYKDILPEVFPYSLPGDIRWLDVGCGYGEFLEALSRHFSSKVRLFGSEPNIKKQRAAQSRGHAVSYFDLGTHDQQYDIVSLMNVYSHLPDPRKFLGELARVVKIQGLLLIQTGDGTNINKDNIMMPAGLPDHLSFTNAAALTMMLNEINFEVLRIVHRPSVPFTLLQFAKEVAKAILPNKSSFLRYYFVSPAKRSRSMLVLARRIK